jgi:hypothetical protein
VNLRAFILSMTAGAAVLAVLLAVLLVFLRA